MGKAVRAERSGTLRHKEVRAYIEAQYGGELHAKRVDALAGATLGVMASAWSIAEFQNGPRGPAMSRVRSGCIIACMGQVAGAFAGREGVDQGSDGVRKGG